MKGVSVTVHFLQPSKEGTIFNVVETRTFCDLNRQLEVFVDNAVRTGGRHPLYWALWTAIR